MTVGTAIVTGPTDTDLFTPVTGQNPLPVTVTSGGPSGPSEVLLSTNNATGDAFGRLRTSTVQTLFDSQSQYDKQPLLWNEIVVGDGAATHLPNESSVELSVGTASGASIIRQTKEYIRYQPGKSQLILCTFAFGEAKSNVNKLVGYGDSENGVFFGQDGTDEYVLLRSFSGGSVDDSRKVYQDSWNLDMMDGTGPSGITLDPTKVQIAVIDIEWLGVGRVRMGLNIDGVTYYVHEFLNANIATSVYMTTANLPVRYELTNTGVAASGTTFKQICTQVASEGGFQDTVAYPFSSTPRIEAAVNEPLPTLTPLIAIRPAATFNGVVNRSKIIMRNVEALCSSGYGLIQVIYNPTITGGSWASVNASSAVEENLTATSVTGGLVIASFTVTGANTPSSTQSVDLNSRLPLTLDHNGANPIGLAVVGAEISLNPVMTAIVNWDELR